MNKNIYPWIPIYGLFKVIFEVVLGSEDFESIGINSFKGIMLHAIYQALVVIFTLMSLLL